MKGFVIFFCSFVILSLADLFTRISRPLKIDPRWLLVTSFPMIAVGAYLGFLGLWRMLQ